MPKKNATTFQINLEARDLANKVRAVAEANIVPVEAAMRNRDELRSADEAAARDILNMFVRLSRVVRKLAKNPHPIGAVAAKALVEQTYENTHQLHQIPISRMRPIADSLPQFPVLASRQPQSGKVIADQLLRLKVGEKRLPGYDAKARWKQDDFGSIAEEIVFQLTEGDPQWAALAANNWAAVKRWIRSDLLPKRLDKAEYEFLAERLTAPGDHTSKSRARERVKERILERMEAILGVRREKSVK